MILRFVSRWPFQALYGRILAVLKELSFHPFRFRVRADLRGDPRRKEAKEPSDLTPAHVFAIHYFHVSLCADRSIIIPDLDSG